MAKSKKDRRLGELAARIRVCTKCPLWESRRLAVPGDGKFASKEKNVFSPPYLDHRLIFIVIVRAKFYGI